MNTINRSYEQFLSFMYSIGSYWSVALSLWIVADVLGRTLLNKPMEGTAELVAYSLPFATFMQIPWILRQRAHLRSPLFDEWLSKGVKKMFFAFGNLIGILVFFLACYSIWKPMLIAWENNETVGNGALDLSAGPLWLSIFLGCGFMIIEFIMQTLNHEKTVGTKS